MNKLIVMLKEMAALFIRFCGLSFLIRNIYTKNKVTVIQYHDPTPEVLEKHLNYLSRRYNFIALDTLVNAIHAKNWESIPPRSLVITFDDGHKGNFNLLGLFRKYKITPTIYICSQIVNSGRHYWFKVKNVKPYKFKKLSNSHRLRALNEGFGFNPVKEYEERQALKEYEVMLMQDVVDFQSHSCFHPILTTCDDDECKREIVQSKADIEDFFKKRCKHFAFPNGDYTEREAKFVKDAGYLSARTVDVGWNDINTDPYKLKIIGITDKASVNFLIAQLSGMTMYLRYLSKGSLNGHHKTNTIAR